MLDAGRGYLESSCKLFISHQAALLSVDIAVSVLTYRTCPRQKCRELLAKNASALQPSVYARSASSLDRAMLHYMGLDENSVLGLTYNPSLAFSRVG